MLWTYDVETNGFISQLHTMWCACLKQLGRDNWVIFTDYEKIPDTFKEAFEDKQEITWRPKEDIADWLAISDITGLICHNQLMYDLEVFRRLYGIGYTVSPDSINGRPIELIDTYVMSTRQCPNRQLPFGTPEWIEVVGSRKRKKIGAHGLAGWGYRVGNMKPEVEDWSDQPLQVYIHRCIEDVKINEATYKYLLDEKGRLMQAI